MQAGNRRSFLAAATGVLLAAPLRAADSGAADAARGVVDGFVGAKRFQGVIHFVRGRKTVFSKAYGMADIEAKRPASIDTLYPLASISKWITSVTVLRLVDQGKLRLDAAIADHLGYYRADTGGKVRLAHLLSNSSGIPNLFNPMVKADPTLWTKSFTTEAAIRSFCSGDLMFAPGSRFSYDFTNWVIVQGMIEAVTGEDFAAAVNRLTLAPLGLKTIIPAYAPEALARVAAGYATIDPPVRKMRPRTNYTLASGGYCGTVPDLIRAVAGIYGTRLLSPASLTALSTPIVPEEHYALGGRVKTLTVAGAAQRFAWETGRVDGYRSLLAHRLDGKASLVLLNNNDLSQRDIDLFAEALLTG